MWPFKRRKKTMIRRTAEKVIAGAIIGAAISSIIGKTMLEKSEKEEKEQE
jgi:hypothetical protein